MRWMIFTILISLITSISLCAEERDAPKPAQSTDELRQQLEKILKDTHTNGASVAIVHKNGPEWVSGLGVADLASGRAATADTLFRVGSISKTFVSLSILMLVDRGMLTLDDPVHKLAPEVWFENRWEASDPIRIVNLLEHTTGWDDLHLREYAKQAPDSMSLREGLDYDHHSRSSRWRPGTRMSYCNSGPAVAAYVVEKLSGQKFEDFVQQNFFRPLGMKTATYFEPAPGSGTTGYQDDGKTPYQYSHILMRPAGSINASANDMAAYLQFYLDRGALGGKQIVPASDIDRMEIPASTWAAKDGMKVGYGLSNFWSVHDGFVYHGHDGDIDGGSADMSYMPDYGVAYFYSINSENGDAFDRIGNAIRAYITRNLQKPPVPPIVPLPANASDYAGWYESNSPRTEITHFISRLTGLTRIEFKAGSLLSSSIGSLNDTYLPITGAQFRHVPKQEPLEPIASLALVTANPEGRFIQNGFSGLVLKQIPTWYAICEILLTAFVFLSMVSIVLYAPLWICGGLIKRRRRPAERPMRLWPLVAVFSLLTFVGIFILSGDDIINRLGNKTIWSQTLCLSSVLYGIAVLFSAIACWRAPKESVRRGVRAYSRIVTTALLILAFYLVYWHVLGLRTWT